MTYLSYGKEKKEKLITFINELNKKHKTIIIKSITRSFIMLNTMNTKFLRRKSYS